MRSGYKSLVIYSISKYFLLADGDFWHFLRGVLWSTKAWFCLNPGYWFFSFITCFCVVSKKSLPDPTSHEFTLVFSVMGFHLRSHIQVHYLLWVNFCVWWETGIQVVLYPGVSGQPASSVESLSFHPFSCLGSFVEGHLTVNARGYFWVVRLAAWISVPVLTPASRHCSFTVTSGVKTWSSCFCLGLVCSCLYKLLECQGVRVSVWDLPSFWKI